MNRWLKFGFSVMALTLVLTTGCAMHRGGQCSSCNSGTCQTGECQDGSCNTHGDCRTCGARSEGGLKGKLRGRLAGCKTGCGRNGCSAGPLGWQEGGLDYSSHLQPGLLGHQAAAQMQNQPFTPGSPTAQVAYPYYTHRGPRDFLNPNPPSIGP